MNKGIIFYTDNEASLEIREVVQNNIRSIADERNMLIVCSSLKWKMDFGDKNIYFPSLKRSPLSQFRQILSALEHSTADFVFFCEADILYHPSHFDYVPDGDKEVYRYNTNVWKIWMDDKVAIRSDDNKQLSGLCGDREFLLGHYRRRVAKILRNQADVIESGGVLKREGYSKHMGHEPGGHMKPRGVDEFPMAGWESEKPNLDLRHDNNLTKGKRKPEDYHDQKWIKGWTKADKVPGWGKVTEIVSKIKRGGVYGL